ncbi:hypothetical protein [Inconstantimicrobium mannanitabidum]|uniref:Uncharacterized protein n=1 Tax=Inconstantimicrobium mannanitabidum TaxID=1604901 RepID=A0ACB5RDE3_9CLOT|nr:hypothetical protein [Clostridium sp. TW13]GKX66909.1 hypothetical protein rsdtw13_21670 [Clostridium sp. TW13]
MKSNYIAKGGLFTALSIVLLYLACILPTNKIALLVLASAMIPLMVVTCNVKYAFLVYVATSALSFILPNKGIMILYICIFGLFGIIKYFAEKTHNRIFEYLIKYAYFNLTLFVSYVLFNFLLLPIDNYKISIGLLLVLAEILFGLYDYLLTIFISYFINKLKRLK